jgi:hypothetical protein
MPDTQPVALSDPAPIPMDDGTGQPPPETPQDAAPFGFAGDMGHPLAVLDRGVTELILVSFNQYKDNPYLDLRFWQLFNDRKWYPTKRGVTVHASEIDQYVLAVQQAQALFQQHKLERRQLRAQADLHNDGAKAT